MKPRALVSVFDKTGIEKFCKFLHEKGYEVVSTGGTHDKLVAAGIPVTKIDTVTGFPEILGGRVKTLHPVVHGGLLAKREESQLNEIATHNIVPIDVVVCNLYPFIQTLSKPGVTEDDLIEQIDIGGVTMLRAGAKNFKGVIVVSDAGDYDAVMEAMEKGEVPLEFRRTLARKAFEHTLAMDTHIVQWLKQEK